MGYEVRAVKLLGRLIAPTGCRNGESRGGSQVTLTPEASPSGGDKDSFIWREFGTAVGTAEPGALCWCCAGAGMTVMVAWWVVGPCTGGWTGSSCWKASLQTRKGGNDTEALDSISRG